MKKKAKNLIALTVALLLLCGVYLVFRPNGEDGEGDDSTEGGNAYSITAVDHNTLTAITVRRRVSEADGTEAAADTVEFSFTLNDDATGWDWSEDPAVPLDNTVFAAMATAVSEVTSPYKLEGVAEADLAKYGLDSPKISLTFTDGTGTHRLYIGGTNSFNGQNYLCTEDRTVVYTVDATLAEEFRFDIFELIAEDSAPSFDASDITSLEYTKGEASRSFTYYPNGNDDCYSGSYNWFFADGDGTPQPLAYDIGESLTNILTTLDLSNCVAYDTSRDGELGLEAGAKLTLKYQKTTKVTDSNTSIEKEVKTPAEYVVYIGVSESGTIYLRPEGSVLTAKILTPGALADIVTDNPRTLAANELVLIDTDRTDSIVFRSGEAVLELALTHGDDGSVSYGRVDGGTLDNEKLEALLTSLTEARTSAFAADLSPTEGAGAELFTAEFAFNSGSASSGMLTITSYSESYCLVSFMGDSSRLMTIDAANELVQKLADLV